MEKVTQKWMPVNLSPEVPAPRMVSINIERENSDIMPQKYQVSPKPVRTVRNPYGMNGLNANGVLKSDKSIIKDNKAALVERSKILQNMNSQSYGDETDEDEESVSDMF